MKIISCGMTDVGLKRGHNEDNYLINEELNLFVVADGMGGHAGGEYASAIAVNTVEEIVTSIELNGQPEAKDKNPIESSKEKLAHSIRLAGRRIFEKAEENPEYHGMGTTAVAFMVRGAFGFVAHVGDSRLYRYKNGQIDQVTEDHSLIAEKIRHGLITEEEAKNHRMRNVITRSLGYQEDVEVDVSVVKLDMAQQFLICSDGLSGHVDAPEMAEHMERYGPQECARRLIELACERGGEDNITTVIIQVEP